MADIKRIECGPRMSEAVIHNGVVYLAGQVAEDTTADVKGQTSQILNQIDELLALVDLAVHRDIDPAAAAHPGHTYETVYSKQGFRVARRTS